MRWDGAEAASTPTLATLTEVYYLRADAYLDVGDVPPRWKWCPECNGEGVIEVMAGDPDLTESRYDCKVCEATMGLVPAAESGRFEHP